MKMTAMPDSKTTRNVERGGRTTVPFMAVYIQIKHQPVFLELTLLMSNLNLLDGAD